jgi:hypothetical protein
LIEAGSGIRYGANATTSSGRSITIAICAVIKDGDGFEGILEREVGALAVEVEDMKEYLYCQGCRPDDAGLPKGVLSLEPAQVVEETGADERTMGFEVQVGSLCTQCGHYFEIGEWLYVGVVEGLHHGFVYCGECRESEMEEEA